MKAMTIDVIAFFVWKNTRNVTHSPLAYKYLIFIILNRGGLL